MLPGASEDDALVEGEEVADEANGPGGHGEEMAGEMGARVDGEVGGGVIAVVVAWGEE